jgi:membrane protein DedA with SNARE-associated domain
VPAQEPWIPSDVVTDFIFSIIDRMGAAGVGSLIFIENIVPPIPSEAILPLAGFRARDGALNAVAVWVAATIGATLGAVVLYSVGRWFGFERLHSLAGRRWFVLASQRDLMQGRKLFEQHGNKVVFGARCVPLLRSVVSIPAGIAEMPLPRFLLLTALGSGIWNAAFIAMGWTLGENWAAVEQAMGPASYAIAAVLLLGTAVLVNRRLRQVGSGEPAEEHLRQNQAA